MFEDSRSYDQPSVLGGNRGANLSRGLQRMPMASASSEVSEGLNHEGIHGFYRPSCGDSGTCDPAFVAADAKPRSRLKWFRPSEKDVEVCRRALQATYIASGCITWIQAHSRKRRRLYKSIIQSKLNHLILSYRKDPHALCGSMKAFSFHCREICFGHTPDRSKLGVVLPRFLVNHFLRVKEPSRSFFQLSYLGRALPMGDSMVQKKALLKFCEITEHDVPTRHKGIHQYILRGVIPLKAGIPASDRVKFNFHSPGATASATRAVGGFESEMRNALLPICENRVNLRRLFDHCLSGNFDGPSEYLNCRSGLPFVNLTGSTQFTRRKVELIPFPSTRSVGRVVTIPEYGMKARVVQALDTKDTFFGHLHRERLWPILERRVQISQGLGPDSTITFTSKKVHIPSWNATPGRAWYSMDLSNATDTIGREILVDLCKSLDIPESSVFIDRLETKSGFQFPVNRGTSMGSPCSWIILSIIHFLVCQKVSTEGGDFVIRGDDLAAYWTFTQFKQYCSLMAQLGFSINLKKSFTSPSSFTFCERLYHVSSTGIATSDVTVTSVRRFSRLPSDRDGRESFSKDSTVDDLPQITGIRECHLPRKVKLRLLSFVKRSLPIRGKDFDILLSIPHVLGGFGVFPRIDSRSLNLLAWFMLGQEDKFSLSMVHLSHGARARQVLEKRFIEHFLERRFEFGPALERTGAEECLSSFRSRMDLCLFLGEDTQLDAVSSRSLFVRFKTYVKSILSWSSRCPREGLFWYTPPSVESLESIVERTHLHYRDGMVSSCSAATGASWSDVKLSPSTRG